VCAGGIDRDFWQFAADHGEYRGTVVDAAARCFLPSGHRDAGRDGFTRTVTSDGQGDFIVIELRSGTIVLAEAKDSRICARRRDAGCEPDRNCDHALAVGTTTEKVEVHADATLIEAHD